MQNSIITTKNNFSTAKMLSIALVAILVFGALTSLPFGASKIAEAKMKLESSQDGGISVHGCDQSGTNGGISVFGCAKGGDGTNGGRGGIALFATANGGDGGADGADGTQGQTGSALGPNAGTGGVGGTAF
jgi:hypothetical protein